MSNRRTPDGSLVRTARIGGVTVSVPSSIVLPELGTGYATTTIGGVEYRVRTFAAGPASIALGAPVAETERRIAALHLRVLIICGSVIVGTVVVGWVISLIMVNPFRLLAQQARAINAQSNPDEVKVRGVREADEIAEAVEGMLARIGTEQQRTRDALDSARDFAAVASHELRTPLTAMRTNLEVLSTLELLPEQRDELVGDIMRTQSSDRGDADRAGTAGAGAADHRRRPRSARYHRAAGPRRPRRHAHYPDLQVSLARRRPC